VHPLLLLLGRLVAAPTLRDTVLISGSHLGASHAQDSGRPIVVRGFGDMAHASLRLRGRGVSASCKDHSPATRDEAEVEREAKLSSDASAKLVVVGSPRVAFKM